MSVDYEEIYRSRATEYDRLVSAEDCEGNLGATLRELVPLAGARVLEIGVGTGRITRLLQAAGAGVLGCDRAVPMLRVAHRRLVDTGAALLAADARRLPVRDGWADLAIAGWVFGHLRHWNDRDWRDPIAGALEEMERALGPGGTLLVIETLGTGTEVPRPPSDALAEYYEWLENEQGFARRTLRTDYAFATAEEAATVSGFFFGAPFADRIRREGWTRVPECTGVWIRRRRSEQQP
jgi:ubiquinone/menaquinone biosynthesis C-methylase UbiE